MKAAVTKVPNSLELEDDPIAQIQVEARGKTAQGFATIVWWYDIKQNLPSNLKSYHWKLYCTSVRYI